MSSADLEVGHHTPVACDCLTGCSVHSHIHVFCWQPSWFAFGWKKSRKAVLQDCVPCALQPRSFSISCQELQLQSFFDTLALRELPCSL